jgi:hypothetical protein
VLEVGGVVPLTEAFGPEHAGRSEVIMVTIDKQDESTFSVTVDTGRKTTHTVTVPDPYYQKLTGGSISKEELLRRSFEFLLERESNSSILSSFELAVIQRYFPEYESTIATE